MTSTVHIRNYHPDDAKALAAIYYHTIHEVNKVDYTAEQLAAWAPETSLDPKDWQQKWSKLLPLVAVIGEAIVGFAEFELTGHIDCFYVHHEHQGKGIGSTLMQAIEARAKKVHINKIFAEVSITAKPFFAAKGFKVVKEQLVTLRGVSLTNFVMEKHA